MNLDESYIYRKEVDWSLLHEGLTIPVRLQVTFKSLLNGYERGVGRRVTLLVDGQPYEAMLINQNFDREKYTRHADVVQIRFTAKSGLPQKLRKLFPTSYAYLKKEREQVRGKKIRLSEDIREYIGGYKIDCVNGQNRLKSQITGGTDGHYRRTARYFDERLQETRRSDW